MEQPSRRDFVMASTGAVALGGLASNESARADVNSQLRIAVLGINSRGMEHVAAITKQKNVKLVAVCDPDKSIAEKRVAEIAKKYGVKPELETDLRKLYERSDLDAVSIATPNHWHTLAAIWAVQAGKHAYVEKPGTHNVFEGKQLIAAAKKYNRIIQHAVQLRSSPALQQAVTLLRDGIIGPVYLARGLVFRRRGSIGVQPTGQKVPAGLDWDLWQGPASARAFSKRYVHYNWHWHWDFGNGDIGNQGIHQTDMCLWGLGVGLPSDISAMGGKFLWNDDKETPEVLSTSYLYPKENKMIEFEVRPWNTNTEGNVGVGNIFYGPKGYMIVNGYSSFEVFFGEKREPGPKAKDGDPLSAHFANFFEAVRANDPTKQNGPVESAHTSSALAHLGNISFRLGRRLKFDPISETFGDDQEANAFLTRDYRQPFAVPDLS